MKRVLILVMALGLVNLVQAEEAKSIQFNPIHYAKLNPWSQETFESHYDRFEEGRCSLLWKYGVDSNGKEAMLVYFVQAPDQDTCDRVGELYGKFEKCKSDGGEAFNDSQVCYRLTEDDGLEAIRYHGFTKHLELSLYPKDKSKKSIERYFSQSKN